MTNAEHSRYTQQSRWPALVAALAAGGLYAAMPDRLSFGPPWLLPSVVALVLIPTVITHRVGHHSLNRAFGFFIDGVLTLGLVWSLTRLIEALIFHDEHPAVLLRSAALLWATNVIIFSLWYWRLDGGGPHARDRAGGHRVGAFLFPQMTGDGAAAFGCGPGGRHWSPRFIDYLFLAFNTSTALSPTDAPVLSRWAKVLVMIQATISLATVAILIGRAVNIL